MAGSNHRRLVVETDLPQQPKGLLQGFAALLVDLPGGDGAKILRSIHDKILTLPDETIVFPGHGDSTTIAREKRFNPFLQDF